MRAAVFAGILGGFVCLCALAGCGQGGAPPPPETAGITAVEPSTILSQMPKYFVVRGGLLGEQGDNVTLRFSATAGTPFHGGTSATLEIPGIVANPNLILSETSYGVSSEEVAADLTCVWPDGTESTLPAAVRFMPMKRGFLHRGLEPKSYARFGDDVAVYGDTALVGAVGRPWWDAVSMGGAHQYVYGGGEEGPNYVVSIIKVREDGSREGHGVDLSADYKCVSAPTADIEHPMGVRVDAGAVTLYKRTEPAAFGEVAQLMAADAATGDLFGWSLEVSGHRVAVGAPANDDDFVVDAGAAYVFELDPLTGAPTQQTRLLAFDAQDPTRFGGEDYDQFGTSVSIEGDTIVVGAPLARGIDDASGAAYVFVHREGVWTPQQKLIPVDGESGNQFGISVAVLGDTIFVGAPRDHRRAYEAGTVYVFTRSAGTWTRKQHLVPSSVEVVQNFGADVAASLNCVIVGAPGDRNRDIQGAGAAYVFESDGGMWPEVQKLQAPTPSSDDQFGFSVDIFGINAVVGAPGDDPRGIYSGSAFFY